MENVVVNKQTYTYSADLLTFGGKDALGVVKRPITLEVDGIQITPASVIFEDTFEGQSYTSSLRLQNVSSKAVFVRIAAPHAWVSTLLFSYHQAFSESRA